MDKKIEKKSIIKKKKPSLIKPEHHFILASGEKIKDIKELALNLDGIEDQDFFNHVNDQKNDFSNWIGDIFKEKRLAEEISGIKNKKDTQIVLLKHLLKKR